MREVEDQQLRLRPGLADRLVEVGEEILAGRQRDAAQIAAGDDHGELVDRIRRARAEDHVAGAEVAEARCEMPSLEPMVTMASLSGSRSTP